LALTWFARWAQEREEAEAHLRCLNQISRQAATATEMETLVDIALRMPEDVISPVATSLILRDHADAPWTLAGTYGLGGKETETLAARLTTSGSALYCGQCATYSATARQNCPLHLSLPRGDTEPVNTSVICLPLSTERPPFALLNVYLLDEQSLTKSMRRVLESMAAVLSVALDHARLRAREFQMLHRMEQASRQREGLAATLEDIVKDIVTIHRARAGEVFLASTGDEGPVLTPVAAWPASNTHTNLISTARRALLEEDSLTASADNKEQVMAIPLMAEGMTTGVLALASQHPLSPSQQALLQIAAGMMALIIRNSQLYAKLESQAVLEERNRLAREVHDGLAQGLGFLNFKMQQVDRLLVRQESEAARQALGEMRDGVQDLYAEVRQTIQDLRWLPKDGQGLSERLRQYVLDFGDRTGLDITLTIDGEPELSPQAEVQLFRIVQEALNNVYKHAQARHASVRLRVDPGGTTILEIEDDGTGFPEEVDSQEPVSAHSRDHFGLRIMQERAEAMGGQLSLDSVPSRGTRLQVRLDNPHSLDTRVVSAAPEGR
jgi:signal transduction histidine kinase